MLGTTAISVHLLIALLDGDLRVPQLKISCLIFQAWAPVVQDRHQPWPTDFLGTSFLQVSPLDTQVELSTRVNKAFFLVKINLELLLLNCQ